jgi:hypothetical protein
VKCCSNFNEGPQACQSYLPKACLEFADMVRDLGDACTGWDVLHSEEVQWLRQACSRNRARIIARVCESMGMACPAMLDYCSGDQGERMAIVCSEALHHDVLPTKCGGVRVLNYCSCTGTSPNGIVCCMAPWEGLWVFHGMKEHGDHGFGKPYGALFLPTSAPRIPPGQGLRGSIPRREVLRLWDSQRQWVEEERIAEVLGLSLLPEPVGAAEPEEEGDDAELRVAYRRSVAKLCAPRKPETAASKKDDGWRYLLFDEPMLCSMSKKGWNRAYGHTPLITLACGLCEDWHQHKAWKDAEKCGIEAHERELRA